MKIITSSLKSGLKISCALKLSGFNITKLKPLSASRFMCYESEQGDILCNENSKQSHTAQYLKIIIKDNPFSRFDEDLLQENAKSENDLVVFLRNLNGNENSKCTIDSCLINKWKVIDFTLLDLIEACHLLFENRNLLDEENKFECISLLREKGYKVVGDKTASKLLMFMSVMSRFNGKYIPKVFFDYVAGHYKKLTKAELLYFFYVLRFSKFKLCPEVKFAFHSFMVQMVNKLNLDELTIVAHGCFKCELKLPRRVGEIMLQKMDQNIENLNGNQMGEISKYISYLGDCWDPVIVLGLHEKVLRIQNKFNVTSLTHFANIRHTRNSANSELLDILSDRFINEIDPRMKDIERFLLVRLHVCCEIEEPKLLNFVKDRLSSNKFEIFEYPRSFVTLMNYLVYREIYIDNLISYIFSENFLRHLYQRMADFNGFELCSIDCCLELERPDYTGNRFPIIKRNQLLKKNHYRCFMPRPTDYFMDDVKKLLNDIFDCECATVASVLPHLPNFNVILGLDENYKPLKMRDLNFKFKIGHLMKFTENIWLIFLFISENLRPDGVNLNLITQIRIRQLKAAGLVTIESKVDLTKWSNMEINLKKQYLCDLMREALNVKVPVSAWNV